MSILYYKIVDNVEKYPEHMESVFIIILFGIVVATIVFVYATFVFLENISMYVCVSD